MKRRLILTIGASGPAGDELIATLPERLRTRRIGGSDSFAFPAEELEPARELWRSIDAAGLEPLVTGETTWTREDFGQGRLCVLTPPIGPAMDERTILERRPCPVCRKMYYRLTATSVADVAVPPGRPEIFATESGLLTFATANALETLTSAGLMSGAVAIPTRDGHHALLTSTIDLGRPVGPHYRRRCPTCDAPLQGATYFPMFRRPAGGGDVFHAHELGPAGLVVSERFARAAGRIVGDPPDALLAFRGWYPDDQALAVVPDLDAEVSEGE